MAVNIATLSVKFVADTTGLKAGAATSGNMLKVLGSQASGLGGIFSSVSGGFGQLGSAFAAAGPAGAVAAGALVAVGAGAYAAKKGFDQFLASADRIDKTSKLAERLDLTYGSLQKLDFIAGRSGIEVNTLARAMEHMGREMGSGGMSMEARFAEQAKRIGAIKDPALRAAAAFKVFGKAGGELIPLLKNFAQDAARFDRFGGKFGFAIEDKDAKNVERMNDAWGDLVFIGTQLADKFVSKFGGPVAAFLETGIGMLEDWATTLGDMGITWEDVGGFAIQALKTISGLMSLGNSQLQLTIGLLGQVYAGHLKIAALLQGDKKGGKEADALTADFGNLAKKGIKGINEFFDGTTARRFDDKLVNGTDFSKRGGFGGGDSDFGSSAGGFPQALEMGSAGAISATLKAGGNPIGVVAENTQLMLNEIKLIARVVTGFTEAELDALTLRGTET